jgi:putative tricarboxylic transport membrane protein
MILAKKAIGASLVGLCALAAPASAEWKPTKPIEFVVGAGPGGGSDQFARTVQLIIQKYNLVPTSIIVSNKPGGASAEAQVYVKAAGADPHKVVFGNNNVWLLPLKEKVGYQTEDLTPLVAMAADDFILWVNGDAPYRTAKDFIEAAKAQPGKLKIGGTQSKDGDHILVKLIEDATGTSFVYIPFKGGNEAAVQLAGGHIDANTNNPSENMGQWKAGKVRPLCVFSSKRLAEGPKVAGDQGWSDIPTCKEAGIDVADYNLPRTIFAAKIKPEEQDFYVSLFKTVSEKPEWKAFLDSTSQSATFASGPDFEALVKRDAEDVKKVFAREGWLVK